jgi:hypothetical protein
MSGMREGAPIFRVVEELGLSRSLWRREYEGSNPSYPTTTFMSGTLSTIIWKECPHERHVGLKGVAKFEIDRSVSAHFGVMMSNGSSLRNRGSGSLGSRGKPITSTMPRTLRLKEEMYHEI